MSPNHSSSDLTGTCLATLSQFDDKGGKNAGFFDSSRLI